MGFNREAPRSSPIFDSRAPQAPEKSDPHVFDGQVAPSNEKVFGAVVRREIVRVGTHGAPDLSEVREIRSLSVECVGVMEMRWFSVKNFEQFQHYKDRNPPWIKLYGELLDNYEFACLQDASKLHLISIWLLASRNSNRLPYDSEWVARRINATEKVDLECLLEAGFLVENQPLQSEEQVASRSLAGRKQDAIPETETETETESNNGPRRIPAGWEPTKADWLFAREQGLSDEEIVERVGEFKDYWRSRRKDAARSNWSQTFKNRILDVAGRGGRRKGRGGGKSVMLEALYQAGAEAQG